MIDTGASMSTPRPSELWEDEIPSTDNSFLRIGPPKPIGHSHEEDD
ncbi:hypothetical protein [Streptomyces nodosus]